MAEPAVQEAFARPDPSHVGLAKSWSVIAALALGIGIICAVFIREIQAAIEVWNASTAYSHCYLVLPMAIYLLWERRDWLGLAQAEPDLRFTVAALPLMMGWLIAERLGVMEARQFVVVAGVELLFLTVLGWRVFKRISGPLLYLFFLVPSGAFLTPALQHFTAAFSITGLDLLGIPNYSDKFTIETPAGVFFVAEACAGLRFLVAAVAFGVFYSLLSYASVKRRLIFIAASIAVPIIANGFRALGIVVLGQFLGSAKAAAADHLIYGWIFFSIVMLLLIAVGHAFRDDGPAPMQASQSIPLKPRLEPFWCVLCVAVVLGLGPALAGVVDASSAAPVLPEVAVITAPPGCASNGRVGGSSANKRLFTVVCNGQHFDVSVNAFAPRSTSSAMIAERRRVTQEVGAENAVVSVLDLAADAGHWILVQTTEPNRVTAYASWVDGRPVSSGLAGRLAQARDSVVGSDHAPALITITTAESMNSTPDQRKATIERLTALLHQQSDLNARMAALTRLGV